jgi:hypothetical protein
LTLKKVEYTHKMKGNVLSVIGAKYEYKNMLCFAGV